MLMLGGYVLQGVAVALEALTEIGAAVVGSGEAWSRGVRLENMKIVKKKQQSMARLGKTILASLYCVMHEKPVSNRENGARKKNARAGDSAFSIYFQSNGQQRKSMA